MKHNSVRKNNERIKERLQNVVYYTRRIANENIYNGGSQQSNIPIVRERLYTSYT
jgi:hypothetical protein